jgi:hypothetical protein
MPIKNPYRSLPWHKYCAVGGLLLTEDLYLRLFARFVPHAQLFRDEDQKLRVVPHELLK